LGPQQAFCFVSGHDFSRAIKGQNDQVRAPEFGESEGRTADPSTTLPRISCGNWWRWCTSCALLYGRAHTLPCPVQRGRKSGYAPVGMQRGGHRFHLHRTDRIGKAELPIPIATLHQLTSPLFVIPTGAKRRDLQCAPRTPQILELSRRHFSPCHRKIRTKFQSKRAQGLKPHSFPYLYGTTEVVP
jgi:hypothetical protein